MKTRTPRDPQAFNSMLSYYDGCENLPEIVGGDLTRKLSTGEILHGVFVFARELTVTEKLDLTDALCKIYNTHAIESQRKDRAVFFWSADHYPTGPKFSTERGRVSAEYPKSFDFSK